MAKQRAFANQEREYQARRFGKFGRAAVMTLATVMSFIALSLLLADQLYRPDTFKIDQLKITGQFRYLKPSDVEAVVIDSASGNFFSLDLDQIKAKAESLAWVESVDVRREWPETLVISIQEHRPAMRWNKKGKSGKAKWVTTTGQVIELPEAINAKNVITLNGRESQAKRILMQATRWKSELLKHGLEVHSVDLSGSGAWALGIYDQAHNAEFDLLLGHEDVSERLARFQMLFDKEFRFAERPLKRVDARYPDGLAVAHAKAVSTNTDSIHSNEMPTGLAFAVNQ